MRTLCKAALFSVVVITAGLRTESVQAQSGADALIGLFGGLIAAAQVQAAQEAWAREPEVTQQCIAQALTRDNVQILQLVRTGVAPDDPRLAHVRRECARFDPSSLRSKFSCRITNGNGPAVETICNESFAQRNTAGRLEPITAVEAVSHYFMTGQVNTIEVEDVGASQQRRERIAVIEAQASLSSLRHQIVSAVQSPSPLLRTVTDRLLVRIDRLSSAGSPVSPVAIQELRSEVERFTDLARVEDQRMALIAQLLSIRRSIDAQLNDGLPADFRAEAHRLGSALQAASFTPTIAVNRLETLPTRTEGPSFDCGKAETPMERAICSDSDLRRLDLAIYQPFYVLRHLFADRRTALREEARAFQKAAEISCKLVGSPTKAAIVQAAPCLIKLFQGQWGKWLGEVQRLGLRGPAEEAERSIEDHLRLQELLQVGGYLPQSEAIDGIYGSATRAAVMRLEVHLGIPQTGILSDEVAGLLIEQANPSSLSQEIVAARTALVQLTELSDQYKVLSARLDQHASEARMLNELKVQLMVVRQLAARAVEAAYNPQSHSELQQFLTDVEDIDGKTVDELKRLTISAAGVRGLSDRVLSLANKATERNAFLLEGDGEDVVVLYNTTDGAPSVVRNLEGKLVFQEPKAHTCQVGTITGKTLVREINGRLSSWDQALTFPLSTCDTRSLAGNDLVVVLRGALWDASIEFGATLLSDADDGALAELFAVTAAEVEAVDHAEAKLALEIESQIEAGSRAGTGLVFLDEAGSATVCSVAPEEPEVHEWLVKAQEHRIFDETDQMPSTVATSADGAFIAAKRKQCGLIYADAAVLRTMISGFRRDAVSYRFLPVWFGAAEVNAARQALAASRAEALQSEADRQRQIQDRERLTAEKAREEAANKSRQQEALRQQYGAMARAFEGMLAEELRSLIDGRSDGATQKYPQFVRWLQIQLKDRWEVVSVNTTLVDYGVSEYKGRTLEAAFAETTVRMRNRILGEYGYGCFVTGFIYDKEFEMHREPIVIACADAAKPISEYKTAQRFMSQWVVQ